MVCQNEDLKHVAGTVTRKREKKNPTKNDSLCICVIRDLGRGLGWRAGTGSKEGHKAVKPRDYKESIFGSASKWSQESDMVLP